MTYDLIILGGGPAGYLAAERAGHAGMKVLCIEQRELGGVCLNEGCVPTKTLLYSAKLYDGAARRKVWRYSKGYSHRPRKGGSAQGKGGKDAGGRRKGGASGEPC